jgi:hypothetical protein
VERLLSLASELERLPFGGPWTPAAGHLAQELGVALPRARSSLPPGWLLELHRALADRLLTALEPDYAVRERDRMVVVQPRHEAPRGAVVGLHGASDQAESFAGVFAELLSMQPLKLLVPHIPTTTWTTPEGGGLAPRIDAQAEPGQPMWLVGFSAGANLALGLREWLGPQLTGAVSIAAAPSVLQRERSSVPTLHVHGTDDRYFPLADLRFEGTRGADPRAELLALPGWGHALPYRIVARHAWPWMQKHVEPGPRWPSPDSPPQA